MKHLNITVSGKVQGVWVSNQPDGSVYIEAEGDDSALKHFPGTLNEGSEQARVSHIEFVEVPTCGYPSFSIRR